MSDVCFGGGCCFDLLCLRVLCCGFDGVFVVARCRLRVTKVVIGGPSRRLSSVLSCMIHIVRPHVYLSIISSARIRLYVPRCLSSESLSYTL